MDKLGSEQNPHRLRSINGASTLPEDEYVALPARLVAKIQEAEPEDPRPSNHHELHANDSEVPPTQPDYVALDRLIFKQKALTAPPIRGRRNICGGIVLTDNQKMVMLATNCLTPSMDRQRIADAMKRSFDEVRAIRWKAEKLMCAHFDIPRTEVEDRKDLRELKADRVSIDHPIHMETGEEMVVMQVKVLNIIRGGMGGTPVVKRKVTLPGAQRPAWNPRDAKSAEVVSDYRELHRLFYGTDPVDDESFQEQKHYLGSCVKLTDKQLLVMLGLVSLTKPIGMYAIGRAMNVNKNHVILWRRQALEIMRASPPARLLEQRIRKAKDVRPTSPMN